VPDWIELNGPKETGQQGLAWSFRVRTDVPGDYRASLAFECDAGVGHCQVSVRIREGNPALGELILCDSPFDCHTDHESLAPLVRILGALPLRVHCINALSELGELSPRTIVLHVLGLLNCTPDEAGLLRRLVAAGSNLVVLADEFCLGTTEAANRILAPFGLRMKQHGGDEPGLTREERSRRIGDWQARYELKPFDSGPEQIAAHPLTRGVRRLHWFRPCPVVCEGAAVPLVRSPADPTECFAAVAPAGGYVVAVGKSLWSGLSGVGWPYDNDRLLANLLVGGDAEQAIAWAERRA
jgi:hypothetical protein